MPKQMQQKPEDYIMPLNMNGLRGRMLYMPAQSGKGREILLVYGHRSSLESWFGLAQLLSRYGNVTMPDLPGFGGMDSLYKIGKKPTTDSMADYVAAFVKMRYKRRRVTIVGLGYGVVIAMRMLQRFGDIRPKVDMLVSLFGFTHREDLALNVPNYWVYRLGTNLLSHSMTSTLVGMVLLRPFILRKVGDMTDTEIVLWRRNDLRTYMATMASFLACDSLSRRAALPVWHVAAKDDDRLDNHLVEQHLQVVFSELHSVVANVNYVPTGASTAKQAVALIPAKLRRALAKNK